jgi:recombination protein RecR
MTAGYTESLNALIEHLGRLPSIGPKTAQRLAFHILKSEPTEAMALAEAIRRVKTRTRKCRICHNLTEQPVCRICSDADRDKGIICVVEQPKDVINLEKAGVCKWVYHVLGGHIAPLEGVEPADLAIEQLVERVRSSPVSEVVMATNPNMAGDGTSLYICSLLRPLKVKITRLARGLPTGSAIEYASDKILADAILCRQNID